MYIDIHKRLIISDNPSVIEWDVQAALKNGEDLCANPFVFAGHFCQWVTQRVSNFEYKLVSAFNAYHFSDQVKNLTAQGYELALEPVEWNGMLCQWMAKMKGYGVEVENASTYNGAVLPTEQVVTPMPGYKLVAGVHVLGTLASSFGSLSGVVR